MKCLSHPLFYSVVNVFLNKYLNYRLLESHRIVGYFASQFRRKTEGLVKSILGGGKHCSLNTQTEPTVPPLGPVLSHQQSKQKVLGKMNEDYPSQLKLASASLVKDSPEGTHTRFKSIRSLQVICISLPNQTRNSKGGWFFCTKKYYLQTKSYYTT